LAQVLVIYHRAPLEPSLSTYAHNLDSLKRFPGHHCFFLNTSRVTVPAYLKSLRPDLVIYHYTFLATRMNPVEFERQVRLVDFTRDLPCRKAIVAQDEQARSDLVSKLIEEFGVTYVFSPASPPEWPQIYEGADFDTMHFHTILTGYVDEATMARIAKRAEHHHDRPIDIGYRSWYTQPFYGRHGRIKRQIAEVFSDNAPRFGLLTDISTDFADALWGDRWFDFLLECKYTVGVEGGSSVFDRDGSIARCTGDYLREHPEASFEQIEAACFPGLDGQFGYRLLGPRHIEAVMTKTCQVLVEGSYGGVLQPGKHYIELKRDFSNLDEVLGVMKADALRQGIVERAYRDVIQSGRWSYHAFADLVLNESLDGVDPAGLHAPTLGSRALLVWNRLGDRAWQPPRVVLDWTRNTAVLLLGEERLWKLLVRGHNVMRRIQGRPLLSLEYVPTDAELARRRQAAQEERMREPL
jgi:hypothetical protein